MSTVFSVLFFMLAVATAFYAGYVLPPTTALADIFSAKTKLGGTIMPYAVATVAFGSAAVATALRRGE